MIQCPKCKSKQSRVYRTTHYENFVERYRRCVTCDNHYITYETVIDIRQVNRHEKT